MNIVIVEDEALIAQRIERLTRKLAGDQIQSLHLFAEIEMARDYLMSHTVDLVFLDLNVNGKSGFDLLKDSVASPAHTIIISAYVDQAITAFDYGVIDFVAKPFNEERLGKAFKRLAETGTSGRMQQLAIRKKNTVIFLPVTDISHINGADIYSEIVTKRGQQHLHNKSLDRLMQILPAHFIRIHKSHIVDLNHVRKVRSFPGSRYEIELLDGTALPVGRTRYPMLKERLGL